MKTWKVVVSSLLLAGVAQAETWKGTLQRQPVSSDSYKGKFLELLTTKTLPVTVRVTPKRKAPRVKGMRCTWLKSKNGNIATCDKKEFNVGIDRCTRTHWLALARKPRPTISLIVSTSCEGYWYVASYRGNATIGR